MHTSTSVTSTTTASRRTRLAVMRAVALAVVAALAVVLPAPPAQASGQQLLVVRTTGVPSGTEIALLRLDTTGGYFGWHASATTDDSGAVTFTTFPDRPYTLWAAETDLTFAQYLGGATDAGGATSFLTSSGAQDEQRFDVRTAALVRGTVTWPAGAPPVYGEVSLRTWDATARAWALTSYGPLTSLTATGADFTVKAPAAVPVTLSATLERADGSTATAWLGGGVTEPRDATSATTVTAADGAEVAGVRLTLPDVVAPAPTPSTPTTPPTSAPRPVTPPATTPPSVTSKPVAPKPALRPAVRVSPAVSGTAKVGRRLTASPAPKGWATAYRWKRDGRNIARATGRTYRPTTADAGRAITVTVTVRRAGHRSASATSKAVRIAKVSGKVRVAAAKRAVRVTVRATGVKAPTGKVTVKVGSRARTYTLRAAHRGTVTVKAPRGRTKVRATYRGDNRVAKASAAKTLRVR